jgi:hypothetical protein
VAVMTAGAESASAVAVTKATVAPALHAPLPASAKVPMSTVANMASATAVAVHNVALLKAVAIGEAMSAPPIFAPPRTAEKAGLANSAAASVAAASPAADVWGGVAASLRAQRLRQEPWAALAQPGQVKCLK